MRSFSKAPVLRAGVLATVRGSLEIQGNPPHAVRGLCILVLLLLVVCTSCRETTSGPQSRNLTDDETSTELASAPLSERPPDGAGAADPPPPAVAVPPSPSEQAPEKRVTDVASAGKPVDKPEEPEANPFSGCDGCHVDSSDELVLSVHYTEEKIGCIKCHGKSDGHVSDENNEVKPDRLFPPNEVDKFCGECHECERPDETRPKKPPKDRRPNCIDCHHPHSLALTVEGDPKAVSK